LATGIHFLQIASPFYFVIAVKLLADGVLRGAGSMGQFMAATLADLFLRVALSYILAPIFGTNGIWASWPIGWIAATILSMYFYFSGKWKETDVLRE
jgi:Na+-driven multidrug efflux pump